MRAGWRVRRASDDELAIEGDGDRANLRHRLSVLIPRGGLKPAAHGVLVRASLAAPLLLLGCSTDPALEWDEEARLVVENRRHAREVWPRLRAEAQRLQSEGVSYAKELLSDQPPLATLDDHQLSDVALMALPECFGACIFDEQGTGKTVVVIYAFDVLVDRGEVDALLVVAPKSMLAEWRHDFERFMGDLYRVEVVAGPLKSRVNALKAGAEVLVANFETAISMEADLAALAWTLKGRLMLVVDESFNVKNAETLRTRALMRLREYCERAYVLCGTPAPNAAADVVSQFDLVDFGLTFEGVAIPSDRNAAREPIARAMSSRGIFTRNLKSDVLPDLPAKRFTRVAVPFEPVQKEAYEAALNDLILDLRKTTPQTYARHIASFLARRSALLQLCASPASIVPGYAEVPAKLVALDAILDDLVARQGEKVVVWSFYRASVEAITRRYGHYGAVRFDGTVDSIESRRQMVRRFQEDDTVRVFVGNPAAAGAGLTLHRARVAVYESLSPQASHFFQSVDRIHRRGQTREVELIVLLCDRSIEVVEFDRLEAKSAAQRELLRDSDEVAPTRDAMLEELLKAQGLLREAE
jgi:SNF2 family DNA or RNA helicase